MSESKETKKKEITEAKHEVVKEAKHEAAGEAEKDLKRQLKKAERKGRRKGWLARIRTFFIGILCGMLILTLLTSYTHALKIKDTFKALFTSETAVEDHDMTLINHRIFGYKAADFQEAILGDEEQLKKLEVYSREVSDVSMITQAGLFKVKAFTKTQYITYNGKAIYTVDLAGLTADDITLDEETKTVTLRVPAPQLEPINIPSENIQIGDIEKGSVLAFGDIKLTPEQQTKVETAAKDRMLKKLEDENAAAEAQKAAEHSIWEIFQPMISNLSPKYKLKVEFK